MLSSITLHLRQSQAARGCAPTPATEYWQQLPSLRGCHLACEEQKDVALGLSEMNLHDRDERCVHVVALRRARIQDLHRVRAALDGEDWAFKEVLGELVCVQRGRRHNQLQVWSPLDDALYEYTLLAMACSFHMDSIKACMHFTFRPSGALPSREVCTGMSC